MMKAWSRTGFAVLLCALMLYPAAADDASAGRDIAAKWGEAVVKVQMVIKMSISFMGESDSQEARAELTGTIIDPSGLAVVSFTYMDPTEALRSVFGDEDGMNITAEITDINIRLTDGTEIPAQVVLRDKDLDLAFIRPKTQQSSPLPFIDLKDSRPLEILDKTVVLSRLGKVANRSGSAHLSRIQAVVEKPRRFYTIKLPSTSDVLGSPVFAMDGKLVGLILLRMMPGAGIGTITRGDMPIIPVVIPAQDIAKVSAQAPQVGP